MDDNLLAISAAKQQIINLRKIIRSNEDLIKIPVDNFLCRTSNMLRNEEICTVGDLRDRPKKLFCDTQPNFGKHSLKEITDWLDENNIDPWA
ncbi:MAG: hypothetical protein GY941_10115 [Planctomycetes bacterium]|nr:hypothetical protein [Planctomycetota bacterium]